MVISTSSALKSKKKIYTPENRIVTIPSMGRQNTDVIVDFLKDCGLKVILPPPTTDNTIKKGVLHSADMMCFPYKVTLGNYIEAMELGANTLLMYDTSGTCRFSQYAKLHEFTLKNLGYEFEMHQTTLLGVIPLIHKLSGQPKRKILKHFIRHYKRLVNQDKKTQQWVTDKPNIGIIGEIYCVLDEKVNQEIETKIKKFGGNLINTSPLSGFISDMMLKRLGLYHSPLFGGEMKKYKKLASTYFNGVLGGHAFENMAMLHWLMDHDPQVDGIIHILPLSCMPESTIEPYVDYVCKENKKSLLRIYIDENNSEANLETRLETFIELISRKKKSSIKKGGEIKTNE